MGKVKPAGQRVGVRSAAVYARISADVEGAGLGVARQLEDCRKLAADRGWLVGDEYVDNDVSAFFGKAAPGVYADAGRSEIGCSGRGDRL